MRTTRERTVASMAACGLFLTMVIALSGTTHACSQERPGARAIADIGGSTLAPVRTGADSEARFSRLIGVFLPPLARALEAEGTARSTAGWWSSRTSAERELIVSAVAAAVATGVSLAERLIDESPAGAGAVPGRAPRPRCPRSGRLV